MSMDTTIDNRQESAGGSDLAQAANLRYLTPDNAVFSKTAGNMLSVQVEGEDHPVVFVHCSFPHKDKRIYLSIRTIDNKEIGIVRSLDDFPSDTAELLEEQVGIRYFAPEVTKVVKVKEEFGYSYWETETTAGYCRFTVRGGGGNVKLVTDQRLLITDVDGNRFIIPQLDQLSDKEYKMVEMCM